MGGSLRVCVEVSLHHSQNESDRDYRFGKLQKSRWSEMRFQRRGNSYQGSARMFRDVYPRCFSCGSLWRCQPLIKSSQRRRSVVVTGKAKEPLLCRYLDMTMLYQGSVHGAVREQHVRLLVIMQPAGVTMRMRMAAAVQLPCHSCGPLNDFVSSCLHIYGSNH